MRLLSLSSAVLAAACSVGSLHAEAAAPQTPEAQVASMLLPLRNNDIGALFKLAPAEQQAEAQANWKKVATEANPEQKAQFDQFLATLLAPDAIDSLMAVAEPQLKAVNPQELVGYVQMFGGMAAMQMANDPSTADLAKNLQQLVADVAAWLPTAGIEDPKKLRLALGSVVSAVKALGVKSADEFYALDFQEMLKRCGGALKEGKAALKVYGLESDKFIESIKLIDVQGTGDTRTAKAQMTAFDHPYTIPVTLVLKDGRWEVKNEAIEKGIEGLAPAGMGGGQGM